MDILRLIMQAMVSSVINHRLDVDERGQDSIDRILGATKKVMAFQDEEDPRKAWVVMDKDLPPVGPYTFQEFQEKWVNDSDVVIYLFPTKELAIAGIHE